MTIQDLITNKDYDCINYYVFHHDYPSGVWMNAFRSENGRLILDDKDLYPTNAEVLSYKEWDNSDKGIQNGLDILVTADEWITEFSLVIRPVKQLINKGD